MHLHMVHCTEHDDQDNTKPIVKSHDENCVVYMHLAVLVADVS